MRACCVHSSKVSMAGGINIGCQCERVSYRAGLCCSGADWFCAGQAGSRSCALRLHIRGVLISHISWRIEAAGDDCSHGSAVGKAAPHILRGLPDKLSEVCLHSNCSMTRTCLRVLHLKMCMSMTVEPLCLAADLRSYCQPAHRKALQSTTCPQQLSRS